MRTHLSSLSLLSLRLRKTTGNHVDPLGTLLHEVLHGLHCKLRSHNHYGSLDLVVYLTNTLVNVLSKHFTT